MLRIEGSRQAQRQASRRLGFEHQIGQDAAHQRLFDQAPAEHHAVARVMQRLDQRLAHHAGRTDHAVEPRVSAHLEYGRHAAPLLPEQSPVGRDKLDFRGGIRAVAHLVLEALNPHTVFRPVRLEPRHEQTG